MGTHQFLLDDPQNTIFLIVVMVWIQAGFAMTVLSAAIKAIPDDIIEAARLDGVQGFGMFRFITLPSIRGSVVVVVTTIAIGVLKVFDIVRTMTGGQFKTSVVANEFYNQTFRYDNQGLGAALAVVLFLLVVPIIIYNVRQAATGGEPMSTAINPAVAEIGERPVLKNSISTSERARKTLSSRFASLVAIIIAVLWTIPTFGLFVTSFRPALETNRSGWWHVFTDPTLTLDNYKTALTDGSQPLAQFFVNSVVITLPAVLLPILLACLAAYAFAWMDFRGKNVLFVAVFALQVVPLQVALVPLLSLYTTKRTSVARTGRCGCRTPCSRCRWRSS
ncbi:hypothetical protein GCM10025868_07600 [Angustibacter aerolatus]|uniref:ABC transmembrane type-1 domain-containing protein n=1 Tax=Angustibacter aerolatus TaxID=1162965 RepID=A0ABQ6JFB9_9ACTN|nr:hypothetical protein GCM10025868_07600 [Angustibacter aerolatus]